MYACVYTQICINTTCCVWVFVGFFWSMFLVIREMKVKITMRFCLVQVRMAAIKKADAVKNVEKVGSLYSVGGDAN